MLKGELRMTTEEPTPHFRSEFDPNSDTPIEILHVLLLGIVKYFWHDAVNRLSSSQKTVLIAHISSVNTNGLGIPPLQGRTLIQYAGSLIGQDFRAIVQIAPAVLHGLFLDAIYEAWLSLCRVVPLALQPDVKDIDTYCVSRRKGGFRPTLN